MAWESFLYLERIHAEDWLTPQGRARYEAALQKYRVSDFKLPRPKDFLTPARKKTFQALEHARHKELVRQKAAWKQRLGTVYVSFELDVILAALEPKSVATPDLRLCLQKELKNLQSRAWDVIRSSVKVWGAVEEARTVAPFRVALTVRIVELGFFTDSAPDEWVRGNYGDQAADTWMEGDITWQQDYELHLKLHGAPRYWTAS